MNDRFYKTEDVDKLLERIRFVANKNDQQQILGIIGYFKKILPPN
jgi:hypothetical protein